MENKNSQKPVSSLRTNDINTAVNPYITQKGPVTRPLFVNLFCCMVPKTVSRIHPAKEYVKNRNNHSVMEIMFFSFVSYH
jgi:hypothetical protein